MPFPIHPDMLRRGCGYALANAGHDTRAIQAWIGHKNIQHTVRYTELAPDRLRISGGIEGFGVSQTCKPPQFGIVYRTSRAQRLVVAVSLPTISSRNSSCQGF
jgi:hypothetical protein